MCVCVCMCVCVLGGGEKEQKCRNIRGTREEERGRGKIPSHPPPPPTPPHPHPQRTQLVHESRLKQRQSQNSFRKAMGKSSDDDGPSQVERLREAVERLQAENAKLRQSTATP